MTNAAKAAEYRSNIGQDFSLADAYDEDYAEAASEPAPTHPDEHAPLACARRPTGQRVGAFLI